MAQPSRARVKITRITQVALVAKDLQKSMEDYWNILGIGPWDIYIHGAPLVRYYEYHGKPAQGSIRVALTQLGGVQLELVEHLDEDTIHHDFLRQHGEGLHHVQSLVADVDEATKMLVKEGFPCLQRAHFGDNGAYAYIDMKPLHTIWELVRLPDNRGVEPIPYPNTVQTSPAKVKVTRIAQIAIVVKNIHKSMEDYWNILGIGPWDIHSFESPLVYDYEYHGKPAQGRAKIALARVGAVQLELIEHVDGDTIYRDFLMERGEGLHHLQFLVEDVDETVEALARDGFPCIQRARFGDNGAYAYIDMKPLHTIWELARRPDNRGVQPTRYPSYSDVTAWSA